VHYEFHLVPEQTDDATRKRRCPMEHTGPSRGSGYITKSGRLGRARRLEMEILVALLLAGLVYAVLEDFGPPRHIESLEDTLAREAAEHRERAERLREWEENFRSPAA